MPTLSEYAKLSTDKMHVGIMENLITADMLTAKLEFEPMEGNSLLYNRENVLPAPTTHAVGDTWEDTEPTFTQKTASLTILGVQSPLDLFAKATRSKDQDQESALHALMLKAVSRKLAQLVIQGEPEAISTQFEGLDSLTRAETRMVAMDDGNMDGPGTAETELTLDRLDAVMDRVDGGRTRPDALIMNLTMRRKLTALFRAAGSGVLPTDKDEFGRRVTMYDDTPIIISEWITNAEVYNDAGTWPSSTATTIFAVRFGKEKQGYTVLHNGSVLSPEIQKIGTKETKNEDLFRVVMYLQAITYSAFQVNALGGIDSAS